MSDTTNPLSYSAEAAHEVVLELVRAGKIHKIKDAADCFTYLFDHYRSEQKRIQEENKAR